MAFGQNMQEITLKVRAEGRGELDALKETLRKTMEGIDGMWAAVARGDDAVKNMRSIAAAARDVKLLEAAINGLDPSYQKWIQNQRDVAQAFAENARKEAEETARRIAAERAAAAERENIAKLRMAMERHDADERSRISREEQVEIEHDLRQETVRLERQSRTMEQGKEAANKFGYGILHVAHAIQDAQYGFGAVLNNIPLVVQALGGGAGLAGTVMIAGVGVTVFGDHLKQLGREMGLLRDPAKEAAVTIEQMKEKIAAVTAKPWKVMIDYQSIEEGEKQLSILEARLQAYKAELDKQTPMQQKVGKEVSGSLAAFGVGEGEEGPMRNLEATVAEAARRSGYLAQYMAEDPRQKQLKVLRDQSEFIQVPGMDPMAAAAKEMAAAFSRKEADALAAQIEKDARGRLRSDLVESPLRGNADNLDRLITLLEGRAGRQLLGEGDAARGIQPMGQEFVESLKHARPASITGREEEDAATERAESRRKMWDEIERAKRVPVEKEVSSLVSKKAKPLEDELGQDILQRISAGGRREDIAPAIGAEVERRMGDVPNAKEAAARIARQVVEATYADVMAARGPGIDEATAASNVLKAQSDAVAAKGAKVLKDPVTGQPLSDHEKWRLRQMDEEIRNQQTDRDRANTPAGMQQAFRNRGLMQMQGIGQDVARARPDLNQQQVMGVAQRANQLVGQGWSRAAAMNEALLRLNQELFQTMQMMQARQAGFTGSVGQLRQQNRRMQQQRPTLLPTFPGGF